MWFEDSTILVMDWTLLGINGLQHMKNIDYKLQLRMENISFCMLFQSFW